MYFIEKKQVDQDDRDVIKDIYVINFLFPRDKSIVEIEVFNDGKKCRINSLTDGYHWLHFFLSQKPNCSQLLYLTTDQESYICKELFKEIGAMYQMQDKETAWITCNHSIDHDFIVSIASIIEPRFANRSRFFEPV